jgi:2-polyprenyl-3-methyl-5-hydroxy-6-metoxy-1,4-benzoquinol methylase
MTHLSEKDQFLWLKELARIIAPGGLALLTALNATDLLNFTATFSEKDFLKFLTNGYFDYSDHAMDGYIPEDYYRVCFHSRDYINNRWSEHFRVIKIEPNFSNNHQDLVVLMRK